MAPNSHGARVKPYAGNRQIGFSDLRDDVLEPAPAHLAREADSPVCNDENPVKLSISFLGKRLFGKGLV